MIISTRDSAAAFNTLLVNHATLLPEVLVENPGSVNFFSLVVSSVLFTVYYVKSVHPALLEKSMGAAAYACCARYRFISDIFMHLAAINFALFHFFPIRFFDGWIPRRFSWSWKVSAALALLIGIPSRYIMHRGMRDAGEETMTPKKDHAMYGGIYDFIRHPQAVGEFPLWYMLALFAHSPFLVAFTTLVYLPVWVLFCIEEEKDLVLRYGSRYENYRKRVGFVFPK